MALQIECPQCKTLNKESNSVCSGKYRSGEKKGQACGYKRLKKDANKVYWLEYREHGRKKRERIGPSRAAAEARMIEVKKAQVEERHIQRDRNAFVRLHELLVWYLSLREIKQKKSYSRYQQMSAHLTRLIPNCLIRDLKQRDVVQYQDERLSEPSKVRPTETTAPATVELETGFLRSVLNYAYSEEKISSVPIRKWPSLEFDNVRERVLTPEEFELLQNACRSPLRQMVEIAYFTGMRQGEILKLEWNQIDLKNGFIRLSAPDTKTHQARVVRLLPNVVEIIRKIPRNIATRRAFFHLMAKRSIVFTEHFRSNGKKHSKKLKLKTSIFMI